MIKVMKITPKYDIRFKNGDTLTEGEEYFCRVSKNDNKYVIFTNQGRWVEFGYRHFTRPDNFKNYFNVVKNIYFNNYKDLKELIK